MTGPVRSHAPITIGEIGLLKDQLDRLARALPVIALEAKVRRGRPALPDPLDFAVEQLALLWSKAWGKAPNMSQNRAGFMDFAERVLACPQLAFDQSAILTAARRLIEAWRQPPS